MRGAFLGSGLEVIFVILRLVVLLLGVVVVCCFLQIWMTCLKAGSVCSTQI